MQKEAEEKCGSLELDRVSNEEILGRDKIVAESATQKNEELNTDESQTTESNILTCDRLKKVTSIKNGFNGARSLSSNGRTKDINKLQQLQHRVQNLERELKEAAAIEVGLYSIVAEHGSSMNKVHAPARRLSRLYLHQTSQRTTSAKSIVSGLILVAKACGNDVPRYFYY